MNGQDFDYSAAWHHLAGWLGSAVGGGPVTEQQMYDAFVFAVEYGAGLWRTEAA